MEATQFKRYKNLKDIVLDDNVAMMIFKDPLFIHKDGTLEYGQFVSVQIDRMRPNTETELANPSVGWKSFSNWYGKDGRMTSNPVSTVGSLYISPRVVAMISPYSDGRKAVSTQELPPKMLYNNEELKQLGIDKIYAFKYVPRGPGEGSMIVDICIHKMDTHQFDDAGLRTFCGNLYGLAKVEQEMAAAEEAKKISGPVNYYEHDRTIPDNNNNNYNNNYNNYIFLFIFLIIMIAIIGIAYYYSNSNSNLNPII